MFGIIRKKRMKEKALCSWTYVWVSWMPCTVLFPWVSKRMFWNWRRFRSDQEAG